jgi:hypothetical protein
MQSELELARDAGHGREMVTPEMFRTLREDQDCHLLQPWNSKQQQHGHG